MDPKEDATISKLQAATSNLTAILQTSTVMEDRLADMDDRLALKLENLTVASEAVAPLQAQSMATKALHARINRAVSPALPLLRSFSLAESLQRKLFNLSSDDHHHRSTGGRLAALLKYVDCVDRLNLAIGSVTAECEPAVQRLQEAVEFLSRTKATDHRRIRRLKETMVALRGLYEGEVDEMRYEGLLDEALLRLQDEYESILLQLRHKGIGGESQKNLEVQETDGSDHHQLGSELEVEVLRRISDTLAGNDCLDICIDIFVKVRYRRAAKALMRLNPDYLKTYTPEEIDAMEWETLESAITLWVQHFELAVKTVLFSEKRLCSQVLANIMDGLIWPECFVKIADKIMAVFFRFGEGVARSAQEPQKLFKLLDMFDAMDRMQPEFAETFDGEPGGDICARFRELQKLLVHAASKVFWEFGLQIERNQDGAPPPPDGSVPKIVRYTVNYLKCLTTDGYSSAMGRVLRTEQVWRAGFLSRPDPDESLLRDAVASVADALQRNVEAKRARYKDKVLPHVLAMNSYWYVYMRTRNTELGRILGEQTLKTKYKTKAEEAAYSYQAEAWDPLVKLLEREELKQDKEAAGALIRGKMEAFMKGFEENLRRHRSSYCVPDVDLREQIKEAVVKVVVPAYAGFLHSYSSVLQGRSFLPPDSIGRLLGQLFDGSDGRPADGGRAPVSGGKGGVRRREFKNRLGVRGGNDGRPEVGGFN